MTVETAPRALHYPANRAAKAVSLKRRIVAGLFCLSFLVWLAVAAGMVVNARIATKQEVDASFQIASRFIASRIPAIEEAAEPGRALAALVEELAEMRHVAATVTEEGGPDLSSLAARSPGKGEAGEDEDEGTSPGWFTALIQSEPRVEIAALDFADQHRGSVRLASDDSDEILEVWLDFRFILPLTITYAGLILVISLVSIDLIFARLRQVTRALDDLRNGDLATRVPVTGYAEFRPLAEGVNELASHLLAKQRENHQLALRLLVAQEDERRKLANDLHDEMGPHLFGIRATAGALKRLAESGPAAQSEALSETVDAIDAQARTIQQIARRVLSDLRPMSIAQVPLRDSIAELASEFERLSCSVTCEIDCRTQDLSFGDVVDLTAYRFVQESVLNAIRHGEARRIAIVLRHETEGGVSEGSVPMLEVEVVDDGNGPPPKPAKGLGLIGIAERVEALGGSWTAPSRSVTGTKTTMRVPCATSRRIDPDRSVRS